MGKTSEHKNQDKIIIKNMKVYGYHGVLPCENENGQFFYFDIEMYLDLNKAGNSDNIEDTVNYSKVYDLVTFIVGKEKFRLIEKLAATIARSILEEYAIIDRVKVLVKKPNAPIKGEFDWVGVKVNMKRSD